MLLWSTDDLFAQLSKDNCTSSEAKGKCLFLPFVWPTITSTFWQNRVYTGEEGEFQNTLSGSSQSNKMQAPQILIQTDAQDLTLKFRAAVLFFKHSYSYFSQPRTTVVFFSIDDLKRYEQLANRILLKEREQ